MSRTSSEIDPGKLAALCHEYNWTQKMAKSKITDAALILKFDNSKTVDLLLGLLVNPVICDGCRVEGTWEHRCHGRLAKVNDVLVGRYCECAVCFVTRQIGLS